MANKTSLERLRDAERDLQAQLTKLRTRIRVAERGENRLIRNTNKYIERTNKIIAKTLREQERIQEKELSKLERFLGETFETVEEARTALAEQTRKATKRERLAYLISKRERAAQAATKSKSEKQRVKKLAEATRIDREITGVKLNPRVKAYSIRKLSKLENKQVLSFLKDEKAWGNVGLNYLQPNERITVSVPYRYIDANGHIKTGHAVGKKVFQTWDKLQRYVNAKYIDEYSTEEWLGSIEIIKFEPEYVQGFQLSTAEQVHEIAKARQADTNNKHRKERKAYFSKREKARKAKERAKFEAMKAALKAEIKALKDEKKGHK